MKVIQAYRYELQPTAGQRALLEKHAGVARFAYNWALAERTAYYQEHHKTKNGNALRRELNEIKREQFPWMLEVSKCAPQEAIRNLDKAFANFFRRLKQGIRGKKLGFPKPHKKHAKRDSFTLTGSIRVCCPRKIQLPKLGMLRTKESTEKFCGRILGATVSREADRWFVSLRVEVEREIPRNKSTEIVGIDLGIKTFATLSDGTAIESSQPLKKKMKALKRAQRQHSRKKKGSNNRRRSAQRLARLHRKVKNTRKDFLHKATTHLAKTKRVLVLEDLAVANMQKNHCLARAISDQGWGEFRRLLAYKTAWYGSELVVVDRFAPTSKTCSECGCVKADLTLADRVFRCDHCGAVLDRDVNAAINIRNLSTRSSRGSYACGEKTATLAVKAKRKSPRRSRNRTCTKVHS